ncbi:AP-4 complex subunit epsilon-1 [Hypsizygus marmoreus]|uniref:AP-4 complex subunit epsilon-1 n=1 Tax=Hypsizygus marmoreus TaxID=39966 RepID=A0A369K0W8_HYPMA|nr:AP-4 complex subunit epsilon-1 [Hypsizygus marmoreus]
MDVPFHSSGAISRAHYALVRAVESCTSSQSANQYLAAEIKSIRRQLSSPALSLEQCKECLIRLLYCYNTASHGFLPRDAFDFALSQAVSLAEASHSIGQKRIGYLFCAEVMPPNHELQLMLVNTLRKDLEHDSIPRICLALDNVIAFSNEDLIPAVQSRLHDLLSHNSPHVRRRALLAFRSLSSHQPELLIRIARQVIRRVEDRDLSVSSAALIGAVHLSKLNGAAANTELTVNDLLKATLISPSGYRTWFLNRVLHSLLFLGLSEDNIPNILEIVHSSSNTHDQSTLRATFLLLSGISAQSLLPFLPPGSQSPIDHIRHLITSSDPNDVYLFLSCLECMDPVLWAGTSPDIPAVLEGWEVERIMQLLESPDTLIRRITMRLLNRVDPGIIASFYSKAVETIPSGLSVHDINARAVRLLEIVETQSGEDGELYAKESRDLLLHLETFLPTDHPVLEIAVEQVLLHVRDASDSFRISCPTTLITFVVDTDTKLSQTMIVITAALVVEYCGKLSISPQDVLQGLASRLTSCRPSVQDVCLLALLRVAAECNEVPTNILNIVRELGARSGRHIKRRSEQFLMLVNERPTLTEIVRRARSSTLPDFLLALQDQKSHSASSSPVLTPSSSQNLLSASKLRYKAYDAPLPVPKLRIRRASSSPYSARSSRSESFSDDGHDSSSRAGLSLSIDPLSRTVTAGELTLAAGGKELERMANMPSNLDTSSLVSKKASVEELEARMDLIAFDSPFVSDPLEATSEADTDSELDVEHLWNSVEDGDSWGQIRLRVISADVPPFIGDLKIIISRTDGPTHAVLRLRESDEDSCLWRLRCGDARLRTEVKQMLTDEVDRA